MFTKLFSSITDSTIWREPSYVRIVWITMLAKSDPSGFVWASIPGLADAARVEIDECIEAIQRFKSPDKWSRTKENEGKRVEEVEGGWHLLNYEKYRKIRNMDERREYVRKKVAEHRLNVNNVNKCKHSKKQIEEEEVEYKKEEVAFEDRFEIPENLRTEAFLVVWNEWLKCRNPKMSQSHKTKVMFREQLLMLSKFNVSVAIQCIQNSIRNGWNGIFEPKNQILNKSISSKPPSVKDLQNI